MRLRRWLLKQQPNKTVFNRFIEGNTAQLCLRVSAVFLPHFFSLENEKYSAAVASASWLTDAAYPLRVHTVFLRFPNFELEQKSWLSLLVKLCGVA
ncbi:MAG: hypothetical protein KHX05_10300 [Firmicutes bacterium]|nr:hypothetical protein [Bacillota bacterium]